MAPKQSVAVVVVGDIGRSPRMQYHAMSLASQAGYEVDLVGWSGTDPCEGVTSNNNIRLRAIHQRPIPRLVDAVYPLRALWKIITQTTALLWMLLVTIPRPEYILVQTPPAIPLLMIAHLVSFLRRGRLVIDWHNYGYTWLAVDRPNAKFMVTLYKWYEKFFGRGAYGNLCVSRAMQADLAQNWGIEASVLYDRAPDVFRETPRAQKQALLDKYPFGKNLDDTNAFTNEKGKLLADRPALVVSSTSWTADEDFDVLLRAVKACDEKFASASTASKSRRESSASPPQPRVHLVVTGKGGELREVFEAKVQKATLKHFRIFTAFLPHSDYATLLGSADLGVCLHFSSSKLDLPMKVVDMFGAGLPVAALDYTCLPELVQHNVNGVIFHDDAELGEQFYDLLRSFPDDTKLQQLRAEAKKFQNTRWADAWGQVALAIFRPN